MSTTLAALLLAAVTMQLSQADDKLVAAQQEVVQPPTSRRMPKFSWETLPVGWHSSNSSGIWSQKQVDVLARYSIITLEKMQGVDMVVPAATRARKGLYWCQDINNESDLSACMLPGKQVEDQHVLAATAIKKVNPEAVVISYLNSIIQYPWCKCDPFSFTVMQLCPTRTLQLVI
eukprot:COSAG05_NODE_543_length_8789_cov_7.804603_4_plen_175_part_00